MNVHAVAIVTGAHGFVGRHVARRLASQGYTVHGIGHGVWEQQEWSHWELASWLCGEVTVRNLNRIVQVPNVVVHCAGGGSVSFAQLNPLEDFERTVVSTVEVLEYIRVRAPLATLVYPSSASVYGDCASPITEDAPLAPVSQYGIHKLMAEQLIRSWTQRFSLSAAIVRLFSAYGPGLRKQLLWDACNKLAVGDTVFMGTGKEVRDWLHIDDAAELLARAAILASPTCPILNGGSGKGVSVRELLDYLGESMFSEPRAVSFSNVQRAGDPPAYVADITAAQPWTPQHHWREGVAEYVRWWKRACHGETPDSLVVPIENAGLSAIENYRPQPG